METFLTKILKYPIYPHDRQIDFLNLECKEALYGGAAGGGKSEALLLWLAEGVEIPRYSGLFLRRIEPMLYSSTDSPINRSHALYKPLGGSWNSSLMRWRFPSGAEIKFGAMQLEKHREKYQGGAYHRIAWDELTHFTESQYTYVSFSRERHHIGFPIPCGTRSGSNPGGEGHAWVRRRFITKEAEKLLKKLRPYDQSPPGLVFYKNPKRAFVPARVADNPTLDIDAYIETMSENLTPILRARLLNGDWSVIEDAIFSAEWLRYYKMRGENFLCRSPEGRYGEPISSMEIEGTTNFFTIDTAGTSRQIEEEKKKGRASWSVCKYWSRKQVDGRPWLWLRDRWRDKVGYIDLCNCVKQFVDEHDRDATVYIENAHYGKPLYEFLTEEGYHCEMMSTATSNRYKTGEGRSGKVERSSDLQHMMSRGHVFFPLNHSGWVHELEDELLAWTGDEEQPNDQIDACSYASIIARTDDHSAGAGWSNVNNHHSSGYGRTNGYG